MKRQPTQTVNIGIGSHEVQLWADDYSPVNPFQTPAEALAYLQVHGGEDAHYRWSGSPHDPGQVGTHIHSYNEWALMMVAPADLDQFLLSFDPAEKPDAISKHLESAVGRCSTEALTAWLEMYPRHPTSGDTIRAHLAREIIRILRRRGCPVAQYEGTQYSTPIRKAAYLIQGKVFKSCRQVMGGDA